MKKKIFIGITAQCKSITNALSSSHSVATISKDFINLFHEHENVIPIILYPEMHHENTAYLMTFLDGIVFSSGEDIHTDSYNGINLVKYDEKVKGLGELYNRPKAFAPNKLRDQFEIALYHEAKKHKLPILGICRGMQLINVAEGGNLHQELPESTIKHSLEEDGWIHHHEVLFKEKSKLYNIFEIQQYIVSSLHHQAINQLGKDLQASGLAPDNSIEAIEHINEDFIIGFQGHIEKIHHNFPLYKKLINSFVSFAVKRKEKNNVFAESC